MNPSEPLKEALNKQINREFTSSYNYLAMAAWLETTPYLGFSQWMHRQSEEERGHAMKFYTYLNDRDCRITLAPIAQPKGEFSNLLEVFQDALVQERRISQHIRDLYTLAEKEKDPETLHFLGWFLEEQVEEEKSVSDVIDRLKLAGSDPAALLQLDAEAAEREESDE